MIKVMHSFLFILGSIFFDINLLIKSVETKNPIVIPFKRKYNIDFINSEMTEKEILLHLINNTLVAEIGIGTPYQRLLLDVKLNFQNTYIVSINSTFEDMDTPTDLVEFNPTLSSTFIPSQDRYTGFSFLKSAYFMQENVELGRTKIKDLRLVLASQLRYDEQITSDSGVLGLGLNSQYEFCKYPSNLILNLIQMNIIDSYDYFLEYENSNEGKIIIGATPAEYDNEKYNKQSLLYTRTPGYGRSPRNWGFTIDEASYNGELINGSSFDYAILQPDYGIIGLPIDIKKVLDKNIFDPLFSKNICSKITVGVSQGEIYVCDKNKLNKKELGVLVLYCIELKEKFEFDLSEYFLDVGDKSYFLCQFSIGRFVLLGDLFLRKHKFIFNQDTKLVALYKTLPDIVKKKSPLLYYFLLVVSVAIFIIAFLIWALLKKSAQIPRRRRAIELIDNYEYIQI